MLSQKQEDFCYWYVKLKNGTQAAIKAGYSVKTSQQAASENLLKPLIVKRIEEVREERKKANEITEERIKAEYAKIAFSNMQDFVKEGMTFEDLKKMPRSKVAAVESFTVTEQVTQFGTTTNVKVKLHSKTKALEDLGKNVGMFEKDNKQKAVKIDLKALTEDDLIKLAELSNKIKPK